MRINEKAAAALQKPDTKAISMEMTPERQERFQRLSLQIIELLKANVDGPVEGYMLLHFVMDGFEEAYNIRGGFTTGKSDTDH